MQKEAWDHLLALDEWPVRTRQMTIDLSSGVRSTFRDIAPFIAPWEDKGAVRSGDQNLGRPERHHRGQQQDPSRRLRLERRARKGKRAKMSTHCSMIADDANYFKDFRSWNCLDKKRLGVVIIFTKTVQTEASWSSGFMCA